MVFALVISSVVTMVVASLEVVASAEDNSRVVGTIVLDLGVVVKPAVVPASVGNSKVVDFPVVPGVVTSTVDCKIVVLFSVVDECMVVATVFDSAIVVVSTDEEVTVFGIFVLDSPVEESEVG